ncbi:MAG: SAM-dependent methyltransferase [Symbiobacteriaceae bacterium]|nr:SAM-dependent methyltransferase [Symbiobacteriaceae bacterium]
MKTSLDELIIILSEAFKGETASTLVFSKVRKGISSPYSKLTLKPFLGKAGLAISAGYTEGDKERLQTLALSQVLSATWLQEHLTVFSQLLIKTADRTYHLFANRDGSLRLLSQAGSKQPYLSGHDRQKSYLLAEGHYTPFLVELGVMTSSGRIVSDRYDKFRQINRFLEIVVDVYPALPAKGALHVVDFGCGRSYLTFALHWLLTEYFAREVEIVGLDINPGVIAECSQIVKNLGLQGLRFVTGDIVSWQSEVKADIIVALHNCDTATDAALAQGIRQQTPVILVAPCCQHEIAGQLLNESNRALLRHGIVRERLGALVTDSLRSAALEALGWSSQIMEFIDSEHTPKNLLIRARRPVIPRTLAEREAAKTAYRDLKATWQIASFALESYLSLEDNEDLHSME